MYTMFFFNKDLDGSSPYDGSPGMILDSIPVGITVLLYLLGTIGLVFAVVAFVFNIIFRNRKYSPV